MNNTPTALRWLANKRARVAHDLSQLEVVSKQVLDRLADLRLDLQGLDRVIRVYDPALNPEQIENVRPHRRVGGRGMLKATMIHVLRKHSPEWLATDVIEIMVVSHLQLAFETAALRKRWHDDVFGAQLRKLVAERLVERLQDPTVPTSEMGRWRWREDSIPTLADLRLAEGESESPT